MQAVSRYIMGNLREAQGAITPENIPARSTSSLLAGFMVGFPCGHIVPISDLRVLAEFSSTWDNDRTIVYEFLQECPHRHLS